MNFLRSARRSQLAALQRNLARRAQYRALGARGATSVLQYGPLGRDFYDGPDQTAAQAAMTSRLGSERGHPIASYLLARSS
ncbi:MAG: hypothetical protein AAFZ18_24180 [Myxococcota bacterium]